MPGFLLLVLPVTGLLAQQPDALDARRRLARTATEPRIEAMLTMRSPRITHALQSPESLFAFVTRPESFYLERRAAALKGKGVIPMGWVPRLWQTIGQLRHEKESAPDWGLKPHPLYSAAFNLAGTRPGASPPATLTVLGHPWTPPEQPIDYPLTPRERELAPWPWQVEQALMDLYGGLVPSTFAPLERVKAEAYLEAVLAMPCGTDEEAQRFAQATQYSSHFKTPAIMGALRNIALNPALPIAGIQVAASYADATRLWNDSLSWAIGSAGSRDILRDAPDGRPHDEAAYWIRSLREVFRFAGTERRPVPAAVVLEAGRRALDPATGDDWHRLYVYAFSIMEAVDDPPFKSERNMEPSSPQVGQRLAEFRGWFDAQRPGLERLAAIQAPALASAERAMETSKCRTELPR